MLPLLFAVLSFFQAFAAPSLVDIVYDIDQTIATLVHDGPGGDWLADPLNPQKNIVTITYDRPEVDSMNQPILDSAGKPITEKITERYRVYEGFAEEMEKWRRDIAAGRVRISFFSGGHVARNRALLDAIKLKDGSSVRALVTDKQIHGRESMTATGVGPEGRVRERFKKDLRTINPDLSNVILVDDIPNFVPDSQLHHVVWLDEDFPYPERLGDRGMIVPSAARIQQERDKFKTISRMVAEAMELHRESGVPFSQAIRRTVGPVQGMGRPCTPDDLFQVLNGLIQSAAR